MSEKRTVCPKCNGKKFTDTPVRDFDPLQHILDECGYPVIVVDICTCPECGGEGWVKK